MPLALLLEETFAAFKKGAEKLSPWNRLVLAEGLLVDRARGAFITRWFGTGVPLYGLSVRIAMVNVEALRRRYEAARAATPGAGGGLNLTEPLAGLAGQLGGLLLSPSGAILVVTVLARSLSPTLSIPVQVKSSLRPTMN